MSKLQTPSSKIVNRNLLNQKSCPLNPILLYQETNKLKGIVFIICYDSIHCCLSELLTIMIVKKFTIAQP